MASILMEAPDGFGAAVELINVLRKEDLYELATEVSRFLQYKVGAIDTEKWCKKVSEHNRDLDAVKIQSIINALTYLFRSSAGGNLSEETFNKMLQTSMVFTEDSSATLGDVWSKQGRLLQSSNIPQNILGVGKLVDIQWKVGVAISSDTCKNLSSPFVTLALTVADPAGTLKTHTMELTMHQFRNFTNQLREIGQVLEMV